MRVLDIDLDLFLDHISDVRTKGKRQDGSIHRPWPEQDLRRFLEKHCGLSTERPVRGRIVTEHDEVFWIWKDLIEAGKLATPFEVVHADAHADLAAMNATSAKYIMRELLHRAVDDRSTPRRGDNGVNPASYLLFAIACRWLSQLTYVHHPKRRWLAEIPWFIMRNKDPSSGRIQFGRYPPDTRFDYHYTSKEPIDLEPAIRLVVCNCWDYSAPGPFDFVFLAQSPDYTPESSDKLMAVIREYIREV